MAEDLEKLWSNMNLMVEKQDGLKLEEDDELRSIEKGRCWLVGRLHTKRHFNNDYFMATMKIVWRLSKEVTILPLEANLFLFKFKNMANKKWVLDGALWSFDKQLLLFQDDKIELKPEDYQFTTFAIWVRIYDLPLGMRNQKMAIKLGWKIGNLIAIDSCLEERVLGHIEGECDVGDEGGSSGKQYKAWLRALSLKKRNSSSWVKFVDPNTKPGTMEKPSEVSLATDADKINDGQKDR
ncbi:hypothetical protein REPUB_Repub12eG0005600 [Reevesia pubescens]